MNVPGKLGGNNPLVGWLNRLREAVTSAQITSVVGGRINRGANGTQLIIGEGGGGSGGSVEVTLCDPYTGESKTYRLKGVEVV